MLSFATILVKVSSKIQISKNESMINHEPLE